MSAIVIPPAKGIPAFPIAAGRVAMNRQFLSGGINHLTGRSIPPQEWDTRLGRHTDVATLVCGKDGVVSVENRDPEYDVYIIESEIAVPSTYAAASRMATEVLKPGSYSGYQLDPGRMYAIAVAPPDYTVMIHMSAEVSVGEDVRGTTRISQELKKQLTAVAACADYASVNSDYRLTLAYEFHEFFYTREVLGHVPARVDGAAVKQLFNKNAFDVHREFWKRLGREGYERGTAEELFSILSGHHIITVHDVDLVSDIFVGQGKAPIPRRHVPG